MRAISSRFNSRLRRLVEAWRRVGLRALGAGRHDRGAREVEAPSLDFRAARQGGRPEFEQMALRHGIDLVHIALDLRGVVRDAERLCLNCQDVRRCRRWLAWETVDEPRLFCANAPLFQVLSGKRTDASGR